MTAQITTTTSDRELVDYLTEENCVEAYGILYSRYYPKVYSSCRRFVRNPDQCKDLVQDIFLKALEAIPKFKKQSSFSTWLYIITYNHSIEYVRRIQKRRDALADLESVRQKAFLEEDFRSLEKRNLNHIEYLKKNLKPKDFEILLDKYFRNYSINEIAEYRKLKKSSIKMRLLRARNRAKESLLALEDL